MSRRPCWCTEQCIKMSFGNLTLLLCKTCGATIVASLVTGMVHCHQHFQDKRKNLSHLKPFGLYVCLFFMVDENCFVVQCTRHSRVKLFKTWHTLRNKDNHNRKGTTYFWSRAWCLNSSTTFLNKVTVNKPWSLSSCTNLWPEQERKW